MQVGATKNVPWEVPRTPRPWLFERTLNQNHQRSGAISKKSGTNRRREIKLTRRGSHKPFHLKRKDSIICFELLIKGLWMIQSSDSFGLEYLNLDPIDVAKFALICLLENTRHFLPPGNRGGINSPESP